MAETGGYVMIDISDIDLGSSSTQTITGIYNKIAEAAALGKPVVMYNGEAVYNSKTDNISPAQATIRKQSTGSYTVSFGQYCFTVNSSNQVIVFDMTQVPTPVTPTPPTYEDIFYIISTPSTLYHGEGNVTLSEADGAAIVAWATKAEGCKPIIIKDDIQVYGGTKCNNIMIPVMRKVSGGYSLLTPTLTFTYLTANRKLSFVDSNAGS